jgi:hypothetical protein
MKCEELSVPQTSDKAKTKKWVVWDEYQSGNGRKITTDLQTIRCERGAIVCRGGLPREMRQMKCCQQTRWLELQADIGETRATTSFQDASTNANLIKTRR